MAAEARTTLKTYFQTGDKPTQAQFENLIDSAYNPTDDGAPVVGTLVTTVGETGSDTNVPSEQAVREAIAAIPSGSGDIKADGTVPFTAIVSYNNAKTFNSDLQIVDKAYVDGAITAAGGYTDEMAQDAVGGILTDTSTVDFTYNDAGGQITADVKDGSITLAKQANLAANTIIGRVTASTGVPEALTAANVRTIINVADGATANAKATSAEVTTGTDDVKYTTAKAIKDAGITADTHDLTYAIPGADHSGKGIIISRTAGEAVTIGQICYVKSDGKLWLAKADSATTMPGCMVALASISANATGSFLARGVVRDDSWTWTVGGLLYISEATAGLLTQTAPTGTGKQVQVVGVALDADNALFMPNMMVLELA